MKGHTVLILTPREVEILRLVLDDLAEAAADGDRPGVTVAEADALLAKVNDPEGKDHADHVA